MCYFVQLSTHHHLQSAQPLPPFWAPLFIFTKASFSLSSFCLTLSSTVGFVAVLSCIEAPIWFFSFTSNSLSYCPSWAPVASGSRPPGEFWSLCSRHESASQDNDEELRHAGGPASITDHTSKVSLTYTPHAMSFYFMSRAVVTV